jgi:hypothetical protein
MEVLSMKKAHWVGLLPFYLLAFIVFTGIAAASSKMVTTSLQRSPVDREHIIIIDAGHGGVDGGATSCTGVLESRINLEIALRINDISPFEHNISIKLSGRNLIDNEAFLSTSSSKPSFELDGDVGKTYAVSFSIKDETILSKIARFGISRYDGDATTNDEVVVEFITQGVNNGALTYTVQEGYTYYLYLYYSDTYTNFGDIFEWVKQVDVGKVKAYGKNISGFIYGDESIWGSYTEGTSTRYYFDMCLPNAEMTISIKTIDNPLGNVYVKRSINGGGYYNIPGKYGLLVSGDTREPITFTQVAGERYRVWTSGENAKNSILNIQVELGSTATDIEDYIEPIEYTPNADGTVEIEAIYPHTTLVADGSDITATYNRDLNKVIDDIYSKILELA